MKHSNISIFIPHIGCPNCCSFCNQNVISGTQKTPNFRDITDILDSVDIKDKSQTEIAFFGGSFTAVPDMEKYLETVQPYLKQGYKGVRISTRPDCIDEKILDILEKNNVTAVELGAQSMDNEVLAANRRGHTVEDVYKAAELIKKHGFEFGLQMMVGLYRSTPEKERFTAEKIAELQPKTVRIYPVVVLKNTELAEKFLLGKYKLYNFEDCVKLCGEFLKMFYLRQISVIKCGLHASEFVENEKIAGFYHPAFRELAAGSVYKTQMSENNTYFVAEKYKSFVFGHGNKKYFKEKNIKIKFAENLGLFEVKECI